MMADLPDNLRRTVLVLLRLGEATAEDVARHSGRGRSTESYYLNLLAKMNIVKKKKMGRKIYFSINVDK